MKPAVAMVCILQNYSEYWDELDADPDVNLMEDARESPNPKYLHDLEARIPEHGCHNFQADLLYTIILRKCMFEHTSTYVINNLLDNPHAEIKKGVRYNGRSANMAYIKLSASVPDEVKKSAVEELEEIYGFSIIVFGAG